MEMSEEEITLEGAAPLEGESVLGEQVHVSQSSVVDLRAEQAEVRQSGVVNLNAGSSQLYQSAVFAAKASDLSLEGSALTFATARQATIHGGSAIGLYTDKAEIVNSSVTLLVVRDLHAGTIKTGVLLAGRVEGSVETLLDTPRAALAGLAAGIGAALALFVLGLLRRRK